MAVCFICNSKLYGERTRVCSSITPHSNSPYPEKIGELMGEEFVIIVTPSDHMCKRCTSLLVHIDKLENDLKLVKNAMLSYIQKKYGILPADQPVASIEVVNGNLRTDDLEVGQRRVPSGLTVREPSTSAGSNTPTKTRQDHSKIKIYKCGFCPFQSKDLGHVRFHMRSHMKKKDNEKANQTVTKTVTQQQQQPQQQQPHQQQHQNQPQQLKCLQNKQPQKKKLYRCQVCSLSFDSRLDCLDHIQKDHNQRSTSTTEKQETNVTLEETAPAFQPHNILNSIENQQVVIKNETHEDESHLVGDKCTMDTEIDMLLKDNVADENSEVPTQVTQNVSENISGQTEDTQVNQEIPVTNMDIGDMSIGGGETEADNLDIESMLAAIHNDVVSPPNDGGNAQNFL